MGSRQQCDVNISIIYTLKCKTIIVRFPHLPGPQNTSVFDTGNVMSWKRFPGIQPQNP